MSAGGGFFAVSRFTWKRLCDAGNLQMAVAYLCIACGTGRGNRLSCWSAQAIEVHTGLHASRGKKAIGRLISQGYARLAEGSKRTRPRYELLEPEPAPNPAQQMEAGEPAKELIWLPNTVVTGTERGEPSPVRRLRQSGDLLALRLFVDLYYEQNLSADGGIFRTVIWREYSRVKCIQRGRRIVWGFKGGKSFAHLSPSTEAFWEAAKITETRKKKVGHRYETVIERRYISGKNAIWDAIHTLTRMGLLAEVPHLMESARPDCEPIHAFATGWGGEPLEKELAEAADAAGRWVLGQHRLYEYEEEYAKDEKNACENFVPVWDTLPDVQMVGIFRLTYRPHTRLTAEWLQAMEERSREYLAEYRELEPGGSLPAASGMVQ